MEHQALHSLTSWSATTSMSHIETVTRSGRGVLDPKESGYFPLTEALTLLTARMCKCMDAVNFGKANLPAVTLELACSRTSLPHYDTAYISHS